MSCRLLLLINFILFFALAAHAGEPRLEVPSPEFNFGQVYAGEQVEHLFQLSNQGDAALVIDRVRSSCGCTAALLSESTLAPGASAELKVHFDSTRFSHEVVKTVYLYSNDPQQPVVQLSLRGIVQPEITVVPRELDLDDLRPDVVREEVVTIENHGERSIRFSSVTATAAEVSATLDKYELGGGEQSSLRVRLVPGTARDRLNAYVILTCAQSNCDVRVPVFGRVLAAPKKGQ